MMKKPLMSVVVPTRRRMQYLTHCLDSLLAQTYERVEFIVSDNSYDGCAQEVVLSKADCRLRYFRVPSEMSMSTHWDWAMQHVRGDWMTFVGDDDGLPPTAVERVVDAIVRSDLLAVRGRYAWYTWPGCSPNGLGILKIPRYRGERRVVASAQALRSLWRAATDCYSLPMIYGSGWVHHSVVPRAMTAAGRFFNCVNPDMYSGVAIASVIPAFLDLAEITAVAGQSPASTGSSTRRGEAGVHASPISDFLAVLDVSTHPLVASHSGSKANTIYNQQLFALDALLMSQELREEHRLALSLSDLVGILESGFKCHVGKATCDWARHAAARDGISYPCALVMSLVRLFYRRLRPGKALARLATLVPGCGPLPDVTPMENVADACRVCDKLA